MDVITGTEKFVQDMFPELVDDKYSNLPKELKFIHAEEILDMYPDLPRKQRETRLSTGSISCCFHNRHRLAA